MRVLIPVYGSHGDVLPFIAFGQALVRRGHEVLMYAPAPFARHAERAAPRFEPLGTEADFNAALDRPELLQTVRGLRFWLDMSFDVAQHLDRWIERNAVAGNKHRRRGAAALLRRADRAGAPRPAHGDRAHHAALHRERDRLASAGEPAHSRFPALGVPALAESLFDRLMLLRVGL